ncbi:hypothetical protein ACS0OQ_13600 [Stenotrophomonas riyadhensis]|uniref:hypothetical protein n=1 Tax=Stenotrophomonas riyadhensis TaxID=2859893 RepID=UPI003F96635B
MDAIEKRARELLAVEYEKLDLPSTAAGARAGAYDLNPSMRAVVAALTPPEGCVLVPAELLRMVAGCAYPVSSEINPRGHNWSEAYLDEVLPKIKAAMLPASPEVP